MNLPNLQTNISEQREKYLEAWTTTMISIWQDRIRDLKIGYTNELRFSFKKELIRQANGDVMKVAHAFNYYGSFVDMGVGRGTSLSDAGPHNSRKPKMWFNKKYYQSVMKLKEKMAETYGEQFTAICINWLQS